MAYPSFIAASAIVADTSGAGEVTPNPVGEQADDIMLVAAWNAGGDDTTAADGWTEIAEVDGTGNANWWWKRATSSSETGPTISSASTDLFAICYTIRGCWKNGTPFEDATTAGDGTTADDNPDTATVTTTGVERLVMSFLSVNDNTAWASGPPPADWETEDDSTTSSGTDCRFTAISYEKSTAGDVNATQIGTIDANELWASLTLAFIPELSPDVTLDTADEMETADTTPTLEFTGTDPNDDDVRYNIQIDTVNTFDSQVGSGTVDSYSEENRNTYVTLSQTDITCAQSFEVGTAATLTSMKFHLKRKAGTDGDIGAYLYAHSGTYGTSSVPDGDILATSDTVDITTISDSAFELIEFTFSGAEQYSMSASTYYCVVIAVGVLTPGEEVYVGLDNSSPSHGGNYAYFAVLDWSADPSKDLIFYVIGDTSYPLLDKVSGTDAGFTNTTDGGDTDPFDSGDKCDYTVQAGDALDPDTYYWRVRGLDPSGTNTYGSWATTRSFTVTAAAGIASKRLLVGHGR